MIDFIKSNNRVIYFAFAILFAFVMMFTMLTPVAYAAEEVEVKPIDLSKYPFNELPADYPVYWILKSADGSYVYMGSNSADTSIQLIKGAISTATYSASVNGKGCTQYKYIDGFWEQTYSDNSMYYNWYSVNDISTIDYCSVSVYIKNGEELTLVYPKPPMPQVETVLSGVTGFVDSLLGIATQTINWVFANPVALVGFILFIFGVGVMIFKSLTKGV